MAHIRILNDVFDGMRGYSFDYYFPSDRPGQRIATDVSGTADYLPSAYEIWTKSSSEFVIPCDFDFKSLKYVILKRHPPAILVLKVTSR